MQQEKTNNRWRLVLLLGAFSALGPLTIDMYLPSFPEITADFGTRASLVQLSLTACLIGLGLGQIIMGPLSDVHGNKARHPVVDALFGRLVRLRDLAEHLLLYRGAFHSRLCRFRRNRHFPGCRSRICTAGRS